MRLDTNDLIKLASFSAGLKKISKCLEKPEYRNAASCFAIYSEWVARHMPTAEIEAVGASWVCGSVSLSVSVSCYSSQLLGSHHGDKPSPLWTIAASTCLEFGIKIIGPTTKWIQMNVE